MTRKIVLGTLLGGLVLFAWSFVSWTLLPWHTSGFRAFSNEEEMTRVLVAGAKVDGMYTIPGNFEDKAAQEKILKGPFVFAAVRPGPMGPSVWLFVNQVLIHLAAALLATLLLMRTRALSFGRRVLFVSGIGLAGAAGVVLAKVV